MGLTPTDLFLAGTIVGIGLGVLVAFVAIRSMLSQKRITFLEKIEFPAFLPADFLRHRAAPAILLELLEAKREKRAEAHLAELARWVGTTRTTISDTVEYLQTKHFVNVRPTASRRKFVSLTNEGELAARWLEDNMSPDILSYLKRAHPNDLMVRLLGARALRRSDAP